MNHKKNSKPVTSTYWKNKRVLVTGGAGFLGTYVVNLLQHLHPKEIRVPRSKEYDLRKQSVCAKIVKDIDIVIHLAANVGGIGYNQANPGSLFYDNLLMGVHLLEEARKNKVSKFVAIGTICAYPKHTPVPFKEEDLWNGYPEETNAPYGLAKKMMLVQAQAYRQQYNFNAIYLLPVNLYGPGDNFNPDSSHVIPALIKKFVEAVKNGDSEVVVWGTGTPTREFLYVEDAARGILLATEKYNGTDPVNLGSSFEISIKELAETVAKAAGFKGKIVFDSTKPDGQPRRKLDVTKAKEGFAFESQTNFTDGLKRTIKWFTAQNKKSAV
jgi:GDP-L-fucose synthase